MRGNAVFCSVGGKAPMQLGPDWFGIPPSPPTPGDGSATVLRVASGCSRRESARQEGASQDGCESGGCVSGGCASGE